MNHDESTLGPEIEHLLDAERHAPDPTDAVRDDVMARVMAAAVGTANDGASVPGPSAVKNSAAAVAQGAVQTASAVAVVCALGVGVLTFALGAVTARTFFPETRVVYVERASLHDSPAPASIDDDRTHAHALSVHDLPTAAPSPHAAVALPQAASGTPNDGAHHSGTAPRPANDDALAAERTLVDIARAAVARGDAASALEAIDKHQKAYPRGQFVEEREVLAVQALARAGRNADAVARAAQFRKAYPESVLLPVVDQAVR